jgi:hypothetical protein
MSTNAALACINCSTSLNGPFCSQCGQNVHDHSKSMREVVIDLLEGFFHFDGRVQRTIGLLMFKPGEAPRLWNAGKRASLVPPLRLYLFVSLMFFIALSWSDIVLVAFVSVDSTGTTMTKIVADPTKPEAAKPEATVASEADAKPHKSGSSNFSSIRPRFLVPFSEIQGSEADLLSAMGVNKPEDFKLEITGPDGKPLPPSQIKAQKSWKEYLTNSRALNKALSDVLPKLMFLFLPIAAIIFWLVTPGKRHFVDHLSVSLYLHSALFLTLLAIIGVRLGIHYFAPGTSIGPLAQALAIASPIYVVLTMRKAYSLSIFGTIWRGSLANIFYVVNFAIFSLPMLAFLLTY